MNDISGLRVKLFAVHNKQHTIDMSHLTRPGGRL